MKETPIVGAGSYVARAYVGRVDDEESDEDRRAFYKRWDRFKLVTTILVLRDEMRARRSHTTAHAARLQGIIATRDREIAELSATLARLARRATEDDIPF
jgi:hypothetical protein